MTTNTLAFTTLCDRCGLSHREAADFLNVRLDTVKSWAAGRNDVRASVLHELATLYRQIERAADEAIEQIEKARAQLGSAPDVIELALARDDDDARTLGWPCVGAQRAMLGIVIARGIAGGEKFAIVPRGSTPATAAAMTIHRGST